MRITFRHRLNGRHITAQAHRVTAHGTYYCEACNAAIATGAHYWTVNAFVPRPVCDGCPNAHMDNAA